MDREAIIASHHLLWEQFIAAHRRAPKRIMLDFDTTDIPLHGDQPEKFFHGYYDHYCYLPLYVFSGRFPLVAYLRQSKIDGAKHTGAILKLLVTFIRHHWPDVQIVFRGDSGFCRQLVLNWCERNRVDYLVGIVRNRRLEARLYCDDYCARGDMENRIKDQQLDLFAKRASSKHWRSNQWRLILSMLAFVLFEKLRELLSSKYRKLSVHSLRLKLIKIAAVVTYNTRRIRFLMNENCPDQKEFIRIVKALSSG